ncbi:MULTISPECIES: hypothetical protein [unclassified Sporosarcina]|uniref:hypothetical protein n=1 Tax=unclassified Sporosarcina TaxID=2647733 RepID=UPI0012DE2731|nr:MULTISPECIES: hypothetical protein [unclassified Sporosarcina]
MNRSFAVSFCDFGKIPTLVKAGHAFALAVRRADGGHFEGIPYSSEIGIGTKY